MAHLVSLAQFLNTGHLGPLKPGMSVREVVELIGMPESWLGDNATPVPTYWTYGNLEMQFDLAGDTYCEWFQIECVKYLLRGEATLLTPGLALMHDGLHAASTVADYIRVIDDIDRVSVQLVDLGGYPSPMLYIGEEMELNFSLDWEPEEAETLRAQIARIDQESRAVDIYSYSPRAIMQHRTNPNWPRGRADRVPLTLSGRDYLDALARG